MASYKALKGVANNLAQSFCSLMNYVDGDYVMGHIVRRSWETGSSVLRADLIAKAVETSDLATSSVVKSLGYYFDDFEPLLARSGSSIDLVAAAVLEINVDPTRRRPIDSGRWHESPFTCTARIVDDRGKVYEHTINDWWYPE